MGIDLGGTNLRLGLVDAQGSVLASKTVATRTQEGPDVLQKQIVEVAQALLGEAKRPISAIGLGVAGQVDSSRGVIVSAPNLPWKDVPIKKSLEKALGVSVFVTNDVRAAAWAEYTFGSAKGLNSAVCIFVGTGIGGAIICNGTILNGATNTAGEIGHMVICINGRACSCGRRGCLEAYAGGWAIAKEARERLSPNKEITIRSVLQAYIEHNPIAMAIMQEAQDALAIGIANLVNILNPQAVILGGGIIEANPELVPWLHEQVSMNTITRQQLRFMQATLDKDAGVVGAAVFAQHMTRL